MHLISFFEASMAKSLLRKKKKDKKKKKNSWDHESLSFPQLWTNVINQLKETRMVPFFSFSSFFFWLILARRVKRRFNIKGY